MLVLLAGGRTMIRGKGVKQTEGIRRHNGAHSAFRLQGSIYTSFPISGSQVYISVISNE